MSAAVEQKSPIIDIMAAEYGLTPKAFVDTVIATCFPGGKAAPVHLAMFLTVAKEYKLNPFTREIYAFPGKGGGIQIIVPIDGWIKLANSNPQMDGVEFKDEMDAQNRLLAIQCTMYRKDRSHPIVVTEYMQECQRDTDPWKRWPARMLRHKALIQCARVAFGFAGFVDPDEADRLLDAEAITIPATSVPLREQLAQPRLQPVHEAITGREEREPQPAEREPGDESEASGTAPQGDKSSELRRKAETLFLGLVQLGHSDDAITAIEKAAGVKQIEHVEPGDLAAVIAGLEKLGKKK